MIVFDLKCGEGHVFGAWFGSSGDYESQRERGLVACPLCGDDRVEKALMAPNIGVKGNRREERSAVAPEAQTVSNEPAPAEIEKLKAMVSALAKAQKEALKDSQWVGKDFVKRARAIHYGEEDHKPIHGSSSPEDAEALRDEGIAVSPLPFPVIPPDLEN